MKQLPGSTGALRSGPGTRIEGRQLDGYELFGARVEAVEDPAQRPVFRDITLRGCTVRDCVLEGALLENVLVDGLTAPATAHMRVLGCAYRRVVLRGHFANITLLPHVDPFSSTLGPLYQRANGEHWVDLMCDGDWALDISGLTGHLDFRSAVPARLVRRDPETQIVITAEQAARTDWRSVPGLERSHLGAHIKLLQVSTSRDTILIADKSAPRPSASDHHAAPTAGEGAAEPD
ncbi:hypothetical protein ACRAWF_32020 [Streptomyces sp. L7]